MDSNQSIFHVGIQAFLQDVENRVAHLRGQLAQLTADPTHLAALKAVRLHGQSLAMGGFAYNLKQMAALGERMERQSNRLVLNREAPSPQKIQRWGRFLDSIEAELRVEGQPTTLADQLHIAMVSATSEFPLAQRVWQHVGKMCCLISDPAKAVRELDAHPFYAVVLDLGMNPDVLRRVLRHAARAARRWRMPILGVTDKMTLIERIKFTQLGIEKFIPASIASSDFINLVHQLHRQTQPPRGVVFVLDADADNKKAIQAELEREGYKVYGCVTYSELLQTWSQKAPDMLLINTAVRDVNVLTLAKSLKQGQNTDKQLASVYVVLMGEGDPRELRGQAFDNGADDALSLPLDLRELQARVVPRLELRRLLQAPLPASPDEGAASVVDWSAAELGPSPESAPSEVRVLIADDDKMLRKMLHHFFMQESWSVDVAEDGEQAETMLRANQYRFVVLDINMPFKSGFDILNWLRENNLKGATKILVLTANNEDDTVLRAFSLGADDYIEKPVNPKIVVSRIRRFMGA